MGAYVCSFILPAFLNNPVDSMEQLKGNTTELPIHFFEVSSFHNSSNPIGKNRKESNKRLYEDNMKFSGNVREIRKLTVYRQKRPRQKRPNKRPRQKRPNKMRLANNCNDFTTNFY